jgi:hypothetical protein
MDGYDVRFKNSFLDWMSHAPNFKTLSKSYAYFIAHWVMLSTINGETVFEHLAIGVQT